MLGVLPRSPWLHPALLLIKINDFHGAEESIHAFHGLKIVVAKHAGANKEPLLIVATMNSWVGLRNETDEVTQIVEFALPCNWCHLAHYWWLQSIFVWILGSDKPSDLGLEGGERGVRLRTWPVLVMVAELLKLGSC